MELANLEDIHEVPLKLQGDPYFHEGAIMDPGDLLEEVGPLEYDEDDDIQEAPKSNEEGILKDTQEMDDHGLFEHEEGLTD